MNWGVGDWLAIVGAIASFVAIVAYSLGEANGRKKERERWMRRVE